MIDPPWYRDDPVEKIAFNAYAIHTEALEDIITSIGTRGTASYNGFLTVGDKQYIENEVYKRYGLVCHVN